MPLPAEGDAQGRISRHWSHQRCAHEAEPPYGTVVLHTAAGGGGPAGRSHWLKNGDRVEMNSAAKSKLH